VLSVECGVLHDDDNDVAGEEWFVGSEGYGSEGGPTHEEPVQVLGADSDSLEGESLEFMMCYEPYVSVRVTDSVEVCVCVCVCV
jgi:hypothetical protein